VFRESSDDNISSQELTLWTNILRVTKVVVCGFMFLVVLTMAVISKSTFLLMTSNLYPNVSTLKTLNFSLTNRASDHPGGTDAQWIWALILTIVAPYLFIVVKSLMRICFKRTRNIDCLALLAVSI
jgi:hypothetical protein